jgi:hypothetical protein
MKVDYCKQYSSLKVSPPARVLTKSFLQTERFWYNPMRIVVFQLLESA